MAKISLAPGFRFHPTDVELVWYYLKRKVMGKRFQFVAISEVDIYKFAPWDLPVKSCLRSRDLEWYFFCPRDRKYANGSRVNRATENGFWKTTGKDRTIVYKSQTVGMKKTLIFHLGKAPHGTRTDWVMYEFRLESVELVNTGFLQDAFVLCKIFQKSGPGPKIGEQYGAPFIEEDWDDITENEHAVAFPFIPCQEPSDNLHSSSGAVPFQSVRYEVGEPSSMPYLSEAGALSSEPTQSVASEVGEPSSIVAHPEVMHSSSIPEFLFADGLRQLEQVLDTFPLHEENANDEMLAFPSMEGVDNGMLHEDIQTVYNDLDELSCQNGIGLDDISFSDLTGFNEELQLGTGVNNIPLPDATSRDDPLHQLLSEFADDNYLEINDLESLSTGNSFELMNNPSEVQYLFANYSSTQHSSNIFMDIVDVTTSVPADLTTCSPAASHDLMNDDMFLTSVDPLWSHTFP